MLDLRYELKKLGSRIKKLETSSEEGRFFDNPDKKNVRQFAESNALTNKIDISKAIEYQNKPKSVALSETIISPPPPDEIIEKTKGDLSTLERFEYPTPKAKKLEKKTTPLEVKKDLIDKVVERHLSQKDKVKAVKKVLKDRMG